MSTNKKLKKLSKVITGGILGSAIVHTSSLADTGSCLTPNAVEIAVSKDLDLIDEGLLTQLYKQYRVQGDAKNGTKFDDFTSFFKKR